MIYTTLNRIREHGPCIGGSRKLLKRLGKTGSDDTPLAYATILESNGFADALWCLRAEPQHASIWRMYAVRCARRWQHLMTDERSLQALDVAERHARGLATDEELGDAGEAASEAASEAPWDAARCAAWDAALKSAWDAALKAASNAASDTARVEQIADFCALLAAHHAMPGESCALVDWWQGESND